jgi:hypothetical protein
MAQENHNALGQGLKIYTDAMRHLIEERLSATYGKSWWEKGVTSGMPQTMRENLRWNMEKDPGKAKIDFLDPGHFVKIVGGNHDVAFQSVFPNYTRLVGQLNTINAARQDWAHPPSGDLPADEVAARLFTIVEVLKEINSPEAHKVVEIRNRLLKIEPEPAVELAPEAVTPAPAGQLPWWWQVAEPQSAFQNPASIDESLFAATLGGVYAGHARADYLDPTVFFASTYFTENLKQTIRDVASRLSGGDGPAVTEMQTPFGGGKTHALLTLYHLVNSPEVAQSVPGVVEALGDTFIPAGAKVLIFDGYERGIEPDVKQTGETVCSLWGELAYQASPEHFRNLISESDMNGTAPGNAVYRKVLQAAGPCLILIDELVSYLVKLKFSNQRRVQNLYRQTIQFTQELLQEAGNVAGTVVMISLPKSPKEFGGIDPQQLQMELGILDELRARADRVVSKRTPVNDTEIYTLMARRLFKPVSRAVAQTVVDAYRATYARTPELYDPGVFTTEYREQQINAYPFHPELIDVLYKKWSTATDFPRTRAVLQLLASVVADGWQARRPVHAIQSAHVNLVRERIRTRIVSAAGASGSYDAVVAADIIGGDAHADMLDARLGGDYDRHHIARGIATTLLMHSFGGTMRSGALPTDLRLGSVAPNLGPEYVAEILGTLEESLWYVHREGELLRFQTRPNLYRIIAQTAETQPNTVVLDRLRAELSNAVGSASGFRVLTWAGDDAGIPDRPEHTIAVLADAYAISAENGTQSDTNERVEALWDRAGGGFREWRNAVILVVPDRDLWDRAEGAMREVLAYTAVQNSASKHGLEISPREEKELSSRAREKSEALRTALVTAYRWIFFPSEDRLTPLALPVPATKDERIVTRVVERLSDQNYGTPKILTRMSGTYFGSKVLPRVWKDEESPLDLSDLARRLHGWTFLPILPNRDLTLREAIADGVAQKLWAVAIGDGTTDHYTSLLQSAAEVTHIPNLFDGSVWLVRGAYLDLIKEHLAGSDEPDRPLPPTPDREGDGGHSRPSQSSTDIPPVVIPKLERYSGLTLQLDELKIGKTSNLQPYLFKPLAEQDAGAEISITIHVKSLPGISQELLNKRIVEGLEQLGIHVTWKAD